jgi:hypothetical protein
MNFIESRTVFYLLTVVILFVIIDMIINVISLKMFDIEHILPEDSLNKKIDHEEKLITKCQPCETIDIRTIQPIQSQDKQRIIDLEKRTNELENKYTYIQNVMKKVYDNDFDGQYIVNGWFIMVNNVLKTPDMIILGEVINRYYGVKKICFSVQGGFPYFGERNEPIYLGKQEKIGFRAMTVFQMPETATIRFRVSTDDGMRIYYQKVDLAIIRNEKFVRLGWSVLIDQWKHQAEETYTSEHLHFNENDLILFRIDWFKYTGNATACIKLVIDRKDKGEEVIDMPLKNTFCSLLWNHIPLMGVN